MSHRGTPDAFSHTHDLLGGGRARNARRTWAVVALTAAMMLVDIVAGWRTGSMALPADGMHMATHAGALSIAGFAYRFARRHRHDPRFSFGTGKVGDLAGFCSAVDTGPARARHRREVGTVPGAGAHMSRRPGVAAAGGTAPQRSPTTSTSLSGT